MPHVQSARFALAPASQGIPALTELLRIFIDLARIGICRGNFNQRSNMRQQLVSHLAAWMNN